MTSEMPDRTMQLMQDALVRGKAWIRGDMVDITGPELIEIFTDEMPNLLDAHTRVCFMCPAEVQSKEGMYKHFVRTHVEVFTALVELQGADPMPTRQNASNRTVYAQMRLWGWTEEKKTNLEVVMRAPNGSTLKMQAPESHSRNAPAVLIAMLQMTGCSEEDFWNKPADDQAHFDPDDQPDQDAQVPPKSVSTPLLDLLIGQRRALTVEHMAEACGFDRDQVMRAMNYMKKKRLVRKVKNGMWLAIEQRDVQEQQNVNIQATTQVQETPEKPVESVQTPAADPVVPEPLQHVPGTPERPQAEPSPMPVQPIPANRDITDDDVYQVLDLLVPDGFKARHYPAVYAWVEATKNLVRALREG